MGWVFLNARDDFDRYRDWWDRANKSCGNHVLLDSMFVSPLVRHFSSDTTRLGISDDSEKPGILLIDKVKPSFWQTFQPAQAPLGCILFDKAVSACVDHIRPLIASLPGYAVGFSVTQQDPDFSCFVNLDGGLSWESLDYIRTPRLRITGSFESYWNARSKNLTHNLSRQYRRLKEQGAVLELVSDRDPEAIAVGVEEYGRLESTGWKGKEGTAVAGDNVQGRFYREMLGEFFSRDEGVIYRLLLNGKTVASDLCLERKGTLVILKTAYDESVQGLSLGLLLHKGIFESLFNNGKTSVIEFYGPVKEWHTKWTSEIRTMFHINFYRHRWVPIARGFLKRALRLVKTEDK